MRARRKPNSRGTRARSATAAYVATWLAAAAIVAGGAIFVLDDGDPEEVSLPPIKETELVQAAERAGCELRRAAPGEDLDPVVDGLAASEPARPGVYDEAPDSASLVAALRRGVVVIHFRADLDGELLDQLREIQEAAPNGTIVTPDATMPFEIAVTAYRRLLGCRRADGPSFEAALLFRGRFLGSGPDTS